MSISQETIAEIHQHVDIEDVVSDFVSLKKRGQNLLACCPFHDEKTPSFTVSPAKGIYKCFGCGKGGDAISFIMDIEGISYVEALKFLADKYGIAIKEDEATPGEIQKQNEKDSLFIALNFAKEHYIDLLWNNEEGVNIGLSYFKERGFDSPAIRKFELGYSINQWDDLIKTAKKAGHSLDVLTKAGLVIQKENDKVYDRFRGRVIFPIHNITGKVIAFGARTLKKDDQPKYINSPETEIYHKSKILYGIHQARQAIRQHDNCYLVEGYTDVISLHMSGVENVVASSGTSLTIDQIKLVGRITQNITILFDGDPAGIKASLRGIDMILEGGLNVKVVMFPEGEDPDSYAQKVGSNEFQEYLLKHQTDFITFKTNLFKDEASRDPSKKSEVIKEVVNSITKIPDPTKRSLYIKESSQLLNIEEQSLIILQNKILLNKDYKKRNENKEDLNKENPLLEDIEKELILDDNDKIIFQEKETIRILVNYGHNKIEDGYYLYDYIFDELDDIPILSPINQEIINIYKEKTAEGIKVDADYLRNNCNEQIKQLVINFITDKYDLSPNWESKYNIYVPKEIEILKNAIYTNILRLKYEHLQKLIKENMKESLNSSDEEKQNEIMRIHIELTKSKNDISRQLGTVVKK